MPKRIDHYRIADVLGRGTCGTVYRAHDEKLGRDVALKLSSREQGAERDNLDITGATEPNPARKPAHYRAFLTETAAASRLSHPGIVALYDVGATDKHNYLVMELVEGVTLKVHGKGQVLLPPRRVLEIMVQCCESLDYLHSQGFLHRDIKPSNIMLDISGEAKLLDFGIALPRDQTVAEGRKASLGTPNYMSPEQIRGERLGPPTDFYSLATVMYEMLTGQRVFAAKKVRELFTQVLRDPPPYLRVAAPHLPESLAQLLERALQKRPERRFQTGADMASALRAVIEELVHGGRRELADMQRLLRRHAVFGSFSEFDLAELLRGSKPVKFDRDDVIIEQGSVDRVLYLIADGLAQVERDETPVALLGQGDSAGEHSFVSDAPTPDAVVAMTEVFAYRLRADFFYTAPPSVQVGMYRAFARGLSDRLSRRDALEPDILL
ncbi:MAG: serine/threonine-protein kinase [Pseudomonadota bacterium]